MELFKKVNQKFLTFLGRPMSMVFPKQRATPVPGSTIGRPAASGPPPQPSPRAVPARAGEAGTAIGSVGAAVLEGRPAFGEIPPSDTRTRPGEISLLLMMMMVMSRETMTIMYFNRPVIQLSINNII